MVFDEHRGRAVLFGGCEADLPLSAPVGASGETWEWDGREWLLRTPATAPSPRFFHAMAFDGGRRRVVLFGGRDASGANPIDTTWEYDGNAWAHRTPTATPVPQPREVAGLAWDAIRGETVLFGGGSAVTGAMLDDTWTWDGSAWTRKTPPHAPPPRFGHAMSAEPSTGRVLVFGGAIHNSYVDDLWAWDGTDWTQLSSTTPTPPARRYAAMAHDGTRGETLLFGGSSGGALLGDAWIWDGASWSQPPQVGAPTARAHPALLFDSLRREYVLFGGRDDSVGPGNAHDTWTRRDDSAWFATFGSGCPGAGGEPRLEAAMGTRPVLGAPFTIGVTRIPQLALVVPWFGTSIARDGAARLPRDLTPIGMPSCTQWVDVMVTQPVLGVAAPATWTIQVPDAPFLLGLRACFQAAVWDASAPPPNLGITVSNAAAATLGR